MSKDDFQQRLQRLQDQSPQKHSIPTQQPGQTTHKSSRPPALRVGIGGGVLGLGSYFIRYANQNYDALRDSGGLGAIAAYGLGGLALVVIGVVLMMRAIFTRSSQAHVTAVQPERSASKKAIWITSVFGFLSGVISCFYMFFAGALRQFDTEAARNLEAGATGIAAILAIIALFLALLSLVFRGRSLGRVFLYYWCGAILTFATFKLAGINLLKWQSLMEHAY